MLKDSACATKGYVDRTLATKQDKLEVNPTETTDVLTGLTIDGTSYRIEAGLDYIEITISGSTGILSQEDFDTLKNNHNAVIKWADYSYINYYTAEDDGNIYYTNSGTDSTATPTILQTKITINKETKEYYNELFTFPQVESVTDVKVDGTSVVESGVANIDLTGKQDKLEVNPTETTETLTGLKIDGTSYKVDTGKTYIGGNAIRINEGEVRLPEEYQEVEYLQSNGTQYIDTGVVPTNTTGFKTKIFINRITVDVHYFMGARESDSTNSRFGIFAGLGESKGFGWNGAILSEGFGVGVWSDTSLNYKNDRKGIINTQTVSLTETLVPITRSTYLFAANWESGARGSAICRIKEVEFTEGQTTVAHLIPCYRKADNKPGMYDIIRNSFYTNSGTGDDFTVGLIIENNSINVKYDNATIKLNANNELYAIGTGGDVGLEDVILEEDMNAYVNIGNIKTASATNPVLVASAGQTLKDVFNKILGLVRIMPTISRQPSIDVAFTSSLGDEYGTSIPSITTSISTVDGQYTCDGQTQNANVSWSNFGVSGDQGTMVGQTGTLTFVAPYVVGISSPYVFTASADNSEGVPAKDNTGAETDVKVAAGTKTKEKSFSITSKDYPYYAISTSTSALTSGTKGSADLITDNGQTINYQQNNYVHILMLKGAETEQPNKVIEIYNDQFRAWGSMLGGTTKLGSVTFTQANGVQRTYWDYRTNNVSQATDSAKLRLHSTAVTTPTLMFSLEDSNLEMNALLGYEIVGNLPWINIEISTDDTQTWTKWNGSNITLSNSKKVYVRNTSDVLSNSTTNYLKFNITGAHVRAAGPLNSLINYKWPTPYCYYGLFENCTSLICSPHLKEDAVSNWCYSKMFKGCSNLREITMDFKGNFDRAVFTGWVDGVAPEGVFNYKGTDTSRSIDSIPENWTINNNWN